MSPVFVSALLGLVIFGLDLRLDLKSSWDVSYMVLLLPGLWSEDRRFFWAAALLGSALSLADSFHFRPGGESGAVSAERLLPVLAIWGAAFIGFYRPSVSDQTGNRAGLFPENSTSPPEIGRDPLQEWGLPIRDVLEKKDPTLRETAEENRESEKRLRAILDNTSACIFMKDRDLRYILVNRQFENLFHVKNDRIRGKTDYDFFDKAQADQWRENNLWVLETGTATEFEETIDQDDGVHTYITSKFSLRDPDGKIYGLCGIGTDITDRKRMEEARRETEERYRDLYENAPVGYYSAGPDLIIREVNQSLLNLLGYSRDEMVGKKTLPALIPPRYLPIFAIRYGRILSGEVDGFLGLDYPMVHRDGREIPIRQDVSVIRDQSGKIIRTRSVITDVTELKKSMDALEIRFRYEKGLEECSRILLTGSDSSNPIPEAIDRIRVAADADRICIFENHLLTEGEFYCSQAFESFREGFLSDIGNPILKFARYSRRWIDSLSKGNRISGLVASFPSDERAILEPRGVVSLLAIPIQVSGSWYGFIVFHDCRSPRVWEEKEIGLLQTAAEMLGNYLERRNAENLLRRQEEQFRILYNNTPVMLHSIDASGKIVSVSDYWLSQMGYTREEVLGRKSTEFLTDKSRLLVESVILPRFMESGGCDEHPLQFVKKNGEIIDVLLSATCQRDDRGRFLRSLAVSIDVTDRKLMEDQRENLLKELRRANIELEEFAYVVSHDLKAPLRAISSLSKWIAPGTTRTSWTRRGWRTWVFSKTAPNG